MKIKKWLIPTIALLGAVAITTPILVSCGHSKTDIKDIKTLVKAVTKGVLSNISLYNNPTITPLTPEEYKSIDYNVVEKSWNVISEVIVYPYKKYFYYFLVSCSNPLKNYCITSLPMVENEFINVPPTQFFLNTFSEKAIVIEDIETNYYPEKWEIFTYLENDK